MDTTYLIYLDGKAYEIPSNLPFDELVKIFPQPELKLINPMAPEMYQAINKWTWGTPETKTQLEFFAKKGYKLEFTYKRLLNDEKGKVNEFNLIVNLDTNSMTTQIPIDIEYKALIAKINELLPELKEQKKWVYWYYHNSKPITRIMGSKSLDIAKYVNRFTQDFVINIYKPELDPFLGRK